MSLLGTLSSAAAQVNPLNRADRTSDVLLSYAFHVMDVSFSVPTVFTLTYGFRFCTAPELNIDTQDIKEGTWEYPKRIAKGANISDITLERGASFFDSDFYDWTSATVRGQSSQRKNLLLIHYSLIGIGSLNSPGDQLGALSLAVQPLQEIISRVPARAWMLFDCIPTQYKAGTDFDAQGSDVSLMYLTIHPNYFEEISLGLG